MDFLDVPTQILDEIPLFRSLCCLVLINAELAKGTEVARPPSDYLVDPSRSDDVARNDTAVTNWDDLFQCLQILCPLLVEVERT